MEKERPNRKKIEKKIKKLETSNYLSPYAYAYLNILRFFYANKFGSLEEQIDAIESVLLFEGYTGSKGKFLDENTRLNMRRKLFLLNVEALRYGDAIEAYHNLKVIDDQAEQLFGDTIANINDIYSSDQAVVLDLSIHPRGYTSLQLFKREFYFSDIAGELSGIKLRCRYKFLELPLQPESQYQVPDSWGDCNLQIIGTAESTFKLVQI